MTKIVLKIDGMSCNHCKMSVEKALAQVKGIKTYQVSLEKGEAEITGDPDLAQVIAAIDDLGYQAQLK